LHTPKGDLTELRVFEPAFDSSTAPFIVIVDIITTSAIGPARSRDFADTALACMMIWTPC
jgi:hypothetical protein